MLVSRLFLSLKMFEEKRNDTTIKLASMHFTSGRLLGNIGSSLTTYDERDNLSLQVHDGLESIRDSRWTLSEAPLVGKINLHVAMQSFINGLLGRWGYSGIDRDG